MIDHFRQRNMKGQSAIEYLMTYGWMLLVVAIVGGAIFATVNNKSSCSGEVPGALMAGENGGFGVDNFAVTNSGAQVALVNGQASGDVNVTSVSLGAVTNETSSVQDISLTRGAEPQTIALSGVSTSDSCESADLQINYTVQDIPGTQSAVGEISAQMSGTS